jgi:Domain of unknown function (DUF1906)
MHPSRILCSALLLSALAVLLVLPNRSGTTQAQPGSYLGFDLNEYPGDDGLPILRKTFSFTGYWLSPPPGEKRTNWLGKRQLLQSQGFGFLVLFNGRTSRNLKSSADAKSKGIADGENAVKVAQQEGFPAGTIIFLDIEEGGRLTPAYHDYVNAWIDTLVRLHFRSGTYCSGMSVNDGDGKTINTVKDLQDHLAGRKLTFWIFNDACPPSPGCVFPQTPHPVSQGGIAEAVAWQFAQSPRRKEFTARCAATYAPDGNCYAPGDTAHKWFLDVNLANSANPSRPGE